MGTPHLEKHSVLLLCRSHCSVFMLFHVWDRSFSLYLFIRFSVLSVAFEYERACDLSAQVKHGKCWPMIRILQ